MHNVCIGDCVGEVVSEGWELIHVYEEGLIGWWLISYSWHYHCEKVSYNTCLHKVVFYLCERFEHIVQRINRMLFLDWCMARLALSHTHSRTHTRTHMHTHAHTHQTAQGWKWHECISCLFSVWLQLIIFVNFTVTKWTCYRLIVEIISPQKQLDLCFNFGPVVNRYHP